MLSFIGVILYPLHSWNRYCFAEQAYGRYFYGQPDGYKEILRRVLAGVVLTATSVSIIVEVLRKMGKLKLS